MKTAPLDPSTPRPPARADEARTLAVLLRSSRLTLLRGADGADRSRLLRDGVMPLLHRRASDAAPGRARPGAQVLSFPDRRSPARPGVAQPAVEVALLLDRWDASGVHAPLPALHGQLALLLDLPPAQVNAAGATLAPRLAALGDRFGARFLLVCDGFEAALRAGTHPPAMRQFLDELGAALRGPQSPLHVLLSVGDDADLLLGRFLEQFPGLAAPPLRLSHWDPGSPPLRGRPAVQLVPPAAAAVPATDTGTGTGTGTDTDWASSIDLILSRVALQARADRLTDADRAARADDDPTIPFAFAPLAATAVEAEPTIEHVHLDLGLTPPPAPPPAPADRAAAPVGGREAGHKPQPQPQPEPQPEPEREPAPAPVAASPTARLAAATGLAAPLDAAAVQPPAVAPAFAAPANVAPPAVPAAVPPASPAFAPGGPRRPWLAISGGAAVVAALLLWIGWPAAQRPAVQPAPPIAQAPVRPPAPTAAPRVAAPPAVVAQTPAAPPAAAPVAPAVVAPAVVAPAAPAASAVGTAAAPPSAAVPVPAAGVPSLVLASDGDDGLPSVLAGDLARLLGTPPGATLRVEPSFGWAEALAAPPGTQRVAVVRYDALAAERTRTPGAGLRLLTPLVREQIHFIVRADSPLKQVHEIEGARINIGPVQGGRALTAQTVYQRLFDHPLPAAQASVTTRDTALAELLDSRRVDVLVVVDAQPSAWLARLPPARAAAIRLLALDPAHTSSRRALRSYLPATLQAGVGSAAAQPGLAVMAFLVASGKPTAAPNDAALAAVRALCAGTPALRRDGHPAWREFQPGLVLPAGWPYAAEAGAGFRDCPRS